MKRAIFIGNADLQNQWGFSYASNSSGYDEPNLTTVMNNSGSRSEGNFYMRMPLALLAFCAIGFASAAPIELYRVYVKDGDTIVYGGDEYRLVGFDTPETGNRSKCNKERALGREATKRLRQIVKGGGQT